MIIRPKTAYLCLWVTHHPSTHAFPLMTPSLFINSPTYSAPFDPFSINWNKLNPIHYLKQRICHKSKDGTGPKSTSYFHVAGLTSLNGKDTNSSTVPWTCSVHSMHLEEGTCFLINEWSVCFSVLIFLLLSFFSFYFFPPLSITLETCWMCSCD